MRRLEKFNHWKSYAERDLDAAQAMFETGDGFTSCLCVNKQ